ncbi:PLD nuclease N-terminal domain-containing protein [Streptomyces sp. NPDC003077]|uniref:PLD nuclease N-terminal domain-containing protein n=1 Tax=Streptomyces sp. NPDC003077 TaxID=3154443 RepID=UPI0033B2A95F
MLRYLPFVLVLALWIYAFIDCLNTPEDRVKGLPKVAWVFIVLLFGEVLIGPIAWLVAGKVRQAPAGGSTPSQWHRNHRERWVAPDDNPAFLQSLKDENKRDEQLLKSWEADLRRREDELRRKENPTTPPDGPTDTPPRDRADRAGNEPEDTPPGKN